MVQKYLTEPLAGDIDNIRSLTDYERRYVMQRGREAFESTMKRILEDLEDIQWFLGRPDDYQHIYRHDYGTRLEAVMPHGPPKRELGSWQAKITKEQVDQWRELAQQLFWKLNEVSERLHEMGLFYQVRNL